MSPSDQEERPVLLAVGDSGAREASADALRDAGWEVVEVRTREELETVLDVPSAALVVDAEFAGGDLAQVCRRGAEETAVVAIVEPEAPAAEIEELERAGVVEFLTAPANAALLVRTLRCRSEAESSALEGALLLENAGRVLELDQFHRHFQSRIPLARSEDTHIAVFALAIGHVGPDAGELAEDVLDQLVFERVRAVLERSEEDEDWGKVGEGMAVTRIDEETYGVLVTGMRRIQDAAKIGARMSEGLLHSRAGHTMTVHVGISCFPEDGIDPAALVGFAQRAVQRARTEQHEQIAFYTQSMGRWAFERLTLEKSLRDAIDNGELRVYYQPRVDIDSRRILGMECLVRWQHPQLGLVAPGQFIPLAEETGLITPIGEWVLREACRQNAIWREQGLPKIRVSVNLSPVQFRRGDLFERVLEALHDAGLDEDGLELELTESMLMNDPKATVATLRRLRSAGIHLSIDDFGTGYSSLSYLKRFPIDALKIDRSFVDEITTNPDDAAIATAIILMGHSLRLQVVAEGVETENQLEFLRVLKCNEIQGYLFSPPVPAEQAEAFLLREMRSAA